MPVYRLLRFGPLLALSKDSIARHAAKTVGNRKGGETMQKTLTIVAAALAFGIAGTAYATPSTQIWIPSTDIQAFGVVHFGADTYNSVTKEPSATTGNTINYGLTAGIVPHDDKFGVEVGVDYRDMGMGGSRNPWYFNLKSGIKEGSFGGMTPSLAVGGYDFGTKSSTASATDFRTDSNILYAMAAKTFGPAGRISLGYFSGNGKVLVDDTGKADNTGLLASWDKALNGKWWAAVDYQGGKSSYGALSFGVAYTISPDSSFIFGYNIYNNGKLHDPTFEFNYDVNF